MNLKKKLLLFLIIFAIVDMIIPIPIMTLLLIYVLFEKPAWFETMVLDIYKT